MSDEFSAHAPGSGKGRKAVDHFLGHRGLEPCSDRVGDRGSKARDVARESPALLRWSVQAGRARVVNLTAGGQAGLPLPSRMGRLAPPPVRLQALPLRAMPDWSDAFLADPAEGDIFASRLWYDTTLAHALPQGYVGALALVGEGAALLPLLRGPGGLSALATPYTLDWRPLLGSGDAEAAGRGLGAWLRHRAPLRLEAMDPEMPGLPSLMRGVAGAGISVQRYRHFGNWHEDLAVGAGWEGYLAGRAPELRNTIRRKLRHAAREFRFELVEAPGTELREGIAAYEAVRAASWKPSEPFPNFDAALMQAAARCGALRLGVLRNAEGHPIAAQYWLVSGGRAWLLKLCHAEAQRGASPGTALTSMMIHGLIEHDRVRALDFGRGDDAYKQLWVSQRRQRAGFVLAHAWHPAGLAAVARHRLAGWMGRGA